MADQTDVTTLLAQLEAERTELDVTIAHLRRRLGLSPTNGDATGAASGTSPSSIGRDVAVTGRVRSDEFFRLSISDAIMKYLGIMKQPQNPMAIVNGLKGGGVLTNAKNFYANVNTELKRMRGRNLVVNTPSGWGLSEWYPQKPKQTEATSAKKKHKAKHGRAGRKSAGTQSARRPSKTGGWHQFLGEAAKQGKTMAEAAAEWKKKKAAG